MLPLLLLLPCLLEVAVGAPRQRVLSHQNQLICHYADNYLNDDYIEAYNEPVYSEPYAEENNDGKCNREKTLSNSCTITGPSSIEILDSRNPHDHIPGQRFAVSREGDDQKMKSVMTFEPMTDERTCTLAIEVPAMSENRYADGSTTMEVWVVQRTEALTWHKQPEKGQSVGKATFPTWQVQQGWLQRFHPLNCESKMSYMVELSYPQGSGSVDFHNQLMGKQGAPPIGWRMLQGGC
ncbi:hypothetical protein BBP40_000391 [Aspergillus hancockii]|nr:hypothetical protein BBP40_000391 [Aspergillus hancockii]